MYFEFKQTKTKRTDQHVVTILYVGEQVWDTINSLS